MLCNVLLTALRTLWPDDIHLLCKCITTASKRFDTISNRIGCRRFFYRLRKAILSILTPMQSHTSSSRYHALYFTGFLYSGINLKPHLGGFYPIGATTVVELWETIRSSNGVWGFASSGVQGQLKPLVGRRSPWSWSLFNNVMSAEKFSCPV